MKKMLVLTALLFIPVVLHAGKDKGANGDNKQTVIKEIQCPKCGHLRRETIYANAIWTVNCYDIKKAGVPGVFTTGQGQHTFTIDTRFGDLRVY